MARDLEKYLRPEACETLEQVYEQALSSLCNRPIMRNNIKFERQLKSGKNKYEKRWSEFKEVFFKFDPEHVKKRYPNVSYLKFLIDEFNEQLTLDKKIGSRKENRQWWMFGEGAISIASFLSIFQDINDFAFFVEGFQRNRNYQYALPMLLDKEIYGFGFALACDFLKEAGYVRYPKPDRHLMDVFEESGLSSRHDYEVFKAVIELADTVGETPYMVDKTIWLVCTGNFYFDKKKPTKHKKKELLDLCAKIKSKTPT